MRAIDLIVVHCSATRPSLDIRAADINRWHKARGWGGIGYHFVITRAGDLDHGRHLGEVGAHVYGHNRTSIGICLVGGVAEDNTQAENNFRPAQFATLRSLLNQLREFYPRTRICGHRDLSPDIDGDGIIERHEWLKMCPSFDVVEWCNAQGIDPNGRGS